MSQHGDGWIYDDDFQPTLWAPLPPDQLVELPVVSDCDFAPDRPPDPVLTRPVDRQTAEASAERARQVARDLIGRTKR